MAGKPKGLPKSGGRKMGTLNKRSLVAALRVADLAQDPFDVLLAFAIGDWKALGYEAECYFKETDSGAVKLGYVISPELRANAAKAACEYIMPKRKAIDLIVDENKEEKEKRAKELLDMSNDELAEETRRHLALISQNE